MKTNKLTFITLGLLAGALLTVSGCGTDTGSKPNPVTGVNTYRSLVGPNWKPVDLGVGRKMYFVDKQGNGYLKTAEHHDRTPQSHVNRHSANIRGLADPCTSMTFS
jgi:hypothetical protein